MISVNANSIFQALDEVLTNQLRLQYSKVLSVCFDGASTMLWSLGGVQAECKEKNKNKTDELKVLVFYTTLVYTLLRFKQDTLDLINSVEMLVNFSDEIKISNYSLLSKYFNVTADELL